MLKTVKLLENVPWEADCNCYDVVQPWKLIGKQAALALAQMVKSLAKMQGNSNDRHLADISEKMSLSGWF